MTESPEEPADPTIQDFMTAGVLAGLATLATLALVFAFISVFVSHTETLEAAEWLAGFVPGVPIALLTARAAMADHRRRCALSSALPPLTLAVGASLAIGHVISGNAIIALPLAMIVTVVILSIVGIWQGYTALNSDNERPRPRWRDALYLALGCVLGMGAFVPDDTRKLGTAAMAIGFVAIIFAYVRIRERLVIDPRVRVVVTFAIPVVLALLVWDLSFGPSQLDHDFFLGPTLDVRHGRYMLVDDYSQYGVVVFYFLAAALQVLSFGYGSLMLLLGILTAALFTAIFVVVRIGSRSVLLAAMGALAAIVAGPIGTIARVTQFPSVGALRFGLTWLIVTALVVAFRNDVLSPRAMYVALVFLGLSSVWSFESAFYSIGTFVVVVAAVAWTDGNVRGAVRWLARGAAAVLLALGVVVAGTYVGRGVRPHPAGYFDFIRLYSSGGFGTLPVQDWSLGYLICAGYVVSFVGIGAIILHGRRFGTARTSTIVPLVATTTFGALSFTYFLGRSHPNNLTHISPPFVAMVTLWTALAARAWIRERSAIGAVVVAAAALSGGLLVVSDWDDLTLKVPDSALAAMLSPFDGRPSLPGRIETLTGNPVVNPDSVVVVSLIQRVVPNGAPLLVLVGPAIATEVLVRLDRPNVLPINVPDEDGLVPRRRSALIAMAADIPCETVVVTQEAPLSVDDPWATPLLSGVISELQVHFDIERIATAFGYILSVAHCRS